MWHTYTGVGRDGQDELAQLLGSTPGGATAQSVTVWHEATRCLVRVWPAPVPVSPACVIHKVNCLPAIHVLTFASFLHI